MRPYCFSINAESVALVPPILEHKHFHRVIGRVDNPVFGDAVRCIQLLLEQMIALVRSRRDDFYHDVRCALDAPLWIKQGHFFLTEEDKVRLGSTVLGEEYGCRRGKNPAQPIYRDVVHDFVKQLGLGVLMAARRRMALVKIAFHELIDVAVIFWKIHFCESRSTDIPGINFHNNRLSDPYHLKYKVYPKAPNRWRFRQTHFSHDQNPK